MCVHVHMCVNLHVTVATCKNEKVEAKNKHKS